MPFLTRFPRFVTGKNKKLDAWFARVAAELDAARNISGTGVLRRPEGTYINIRSVPLLLGPGVTTSASTAASGTTPNITPGLVNVTLSNYDGTHLATTGTVLTGVKSNYTTVIPSGKACWVYMWKSKYWLIVADC